MAQVSPVISALEELARRRHELTAAIVTLATVGGVDPASYLNDDLARDAAYGVPVPAPPAAAAAVKKIKRRQIKKAARAAKGTKRAGRPIRPSTTKTKGGIGPLMVDALKTNGGPMTPAALAEATGINVIQIRKEAKRQEKAGTMTRSGTGRGTTYAA